MKKIKNIFRFPNMESAMQDEDCDELSVLVEINLHELEYFIRHMVAAVENASDFSAIKYGMKFHDVLAAWRDDLVTAWPYRKKKAHEQHVANERKRIKLANDERALKRRVNDAGFVDCVSHPHDPENHDATVYDADAAGIDPGVAFHDRTGKIFSVVCSIHGTIHSIEKRSGAIEIMNNIVHYCDQCSDVEHETKGKTA